MTMLNLRRGTERKDEPRLPARPPNGAPSSPPRPRELHPAAQAAAAEYSAVWMENDALRSENQRLSNEVEVAQKLDAEKTAIISDLRRRLDEASRNADERVLQTEIHFRDRLAQAERSKERYLRYAVGIGERLKGCIDQMAGAHAQAMEMANTAPLDDTERRIEAEMKQLVEAAGKPEPGQHGGESGAERT